MIIKLTTESGLEFTFNHAIRIIRMAPDYLSIWEQLPGRPEAMHRIHTDQFTGRIVKLEFTYEQED